MGSAGDKRDVPTVDVSGENGALNADAALWAVVTTNGTLEKANVVRRRIRKSPLEC